jgi:cysteine desulfurase/selenocysteine lyase
MTTSERTGALDVARIRRDFPILDRKVYGQPLVYFDNAATSQKPRQVIEALTHYYETTNANIHRAVHLLGEEATAAYEGVREKVSTFINAPSPECIVFTRNTSESINLVAYAWGRANVVAGDEIVVTLMEHHSNFVPWQQLAEEKGAKLVVIGVRDDQTLDLDEGFSSYLSERTKIVAITHANNTVGTINPVRELTAEAHRVGALVLVDAAQSVPHMPVDVQELDCDFLAFSAHKMLGPTGVGVLYARRELLEEMPPFLTGGEMISKVTVDETKWNEVPAKFEAGTPNIADVVAFGAAVDYLSDLGMQSVREHEKEITEYALRRLKQLESITIYGPEDIEIHGGAISFNYPGVHPHDVGTIVDRRGVAIRGGHGCNQPLMRSLDISGVARASFYVYNTTAEVDVLIDALGDVGDRFSG